MWLRQQYWGWEKLLSTVALSAENTPSYVFPFLENWGWLQTKPCRISWQHAIWQTSKIHALLFKFNVRKLIQFPFFSEQRLKGICLPCDEEWKCWMKEIIVWHDNGILSRCISALDAVCITGKRNLPVRTSNVSWHCFPRHKMTVENVRWASFLPGVQSQLLAHRVDGELHPENHLAV